MKKYKGFEVLWRITFIYTILIFISQFLIKCYLPYIDKNIKLLICKSIILIPVLIGIISIKVMHPYDSLKNMLCIRGFNITLLPIFIIMPISALFFISYISAPFNLIITEIFGEYRLNINSPSNIYDFAILFTVICIIIPVFEEILFRGIFIKLTDRYGTAVSVLISSLASAMIYFDYPLFLPIYLFSVLLAVIRLGTSSLLASAAFHISSNYMLFMYIIFKNKIKLLSTISFGIQITLSLLFLLLMFVFFKFYSNKFYFIGTEKKTGFSFSFLFTAIIFIFAPILINFTKLF